MWSEYIDVREALNMLLPTASGHTADTIINGKNIRAQNMVLQNNTESTALPLNDFFFAFFQKFFDLIKDYNNGFHLTPVCFVYNLAQFMKHIEIQDIRL